LVRVAENTPDNPSGKRMGVPFTKAEVRGIEGGSIQEARLIEACREGNASAFNLLVWRWERPLFNFVYKHVGDAALAQDLVQETFVRVVKSIGQYEHRGSFSTWVFRVAVNLCKDHLRKKRIPVVSLHDYYTTETGEKVFVRDRVADEEARTDEAVERQEREKLVRRLLDGISEEQRAVILLKEYQALTFAEIAEVLDVPEGTVKARLYRGLRAMRAQLEQEGASPHDGSGGAS
jgi:RNA polymerase sigma-70 factor (ECF subfamily)